MSDIHANGMGDHERIRVLHVVGTMNPGGTETWLLNILRFIDRDRFQLHFCTFGSEASLYADEVENLGGVIIPCPRNGGVLSALNRLRRILRQGNYDVVHSHVMFFSGAVLRLADAAGVPVRIAHGHTSRDDKPPAPWRHVYRGTMRSWIRSHATHGLAASRIAAAQLFGKDWERDSRFRVLHCGIDLRPFAEVIDRNRVRQELGIPVGASVVGHVGRFDVAKNHVFALEIAHSIVKRNPNVHFLFVGDGPLKAQIEAQSERMGLSNVVHFAGVRTDVPRLMNGAMDAFILPSLWEGLPLCLLEAQAAGLCCVLSSLITPEASILPERCLKVPPSAPANTWAEKIFSALEQGRTQDDSPLKTVTETDFCIERSSANLSRLYVGAMG